jgi:protein-S-isoprenylcysteine O-methyltransferase Ste14
VKPYERIFGSGPRGALIAIMLLIIAYYLEDYVGFREIFTSDVVSFSAFIVFSLLGLAIFVWSLMSLPPKERGKSLVTTGAYKYFRHPLYAAFLLLLNVGFAFLLNNWIYLCWAALMFPVWSINVRSEETLMKNTFGEEYDAYCKKTWRFVPKLWQ